MTPRRFSSSVRCENLFIGPRILYEPPRWNISALSRTSNPLCSLSSREVSSGVRYTYAPIRVRACSKSDRVSGSMPASIAKAAPGDGSSPGHGAVRHLSRRAERGIGQKRFVGEAFEKRDEVLALVGRDWEALDARALQRALHAAARIVVDRRVQCLDAAVVHVRRSDGDVAQRRRAEAPHVGRVVRPPTRPRSVGGSPPRPLTLYRPVLWNSGSTGVECSN